MPSYTPSTTTFHPNIPIVDDSVPPTASYFNPGLENLADNAAYVNANAVDGVHGGTYAPAAPIIIPLAQFELTDAGGAAVFYQYAPDVVGVRGLYASAQITANGGISAAGPIYCYSSLTVQGNAVLVGTVQLVNATLVQGQVSFTGSGRINDTKTKSSASAAYSDIYANCQIFFNEYAFATTNPVNLTVHHTTGVPANPVDGTTLRFVTVQVSGGPLNLIREDGSTIVTFPLGYTPAWVDLIFDGATNRWVCEAWHHNATNVSVF